MNQTPNDFKMDTSAKPTVLQCNPGYHWNWYWKKCIVDCPTGYHNDSITGSCVLDGGNPPIIISYAGVNISYYNSSHTLGFNSASDVNTVLNQLDADYENYNIAYENQYPNYTALQLDSLDSVKNFDQLQSYKNFEAKFSGYTSKRLIFDNNETTWLNNNMIGADPDSLDYTVDNSDNVICNNNYQFIIAGTTYQWTASGLIVVDNGTAKVDNGTASPNYAACFTNYRLKKPFQSSDQTRYCKLKVAVLDCLIKGSGKAKVKSFRKSNGHWKHSRISLQVDILGSTFYNKNGCTPWYAPQDSKGPKKRSELKVVNRQASGLTYTELGQFRGNFSTDVPGLTGTLILQ